MKIVEADSVPPPIGLIRGAELRDFNYKMLVWKKVQEKNQRPALVKYDFSVILIACIPTNFLMNCLLKFFVVDDGSNFSITVAGPKRGNNFY